MDSGISGSPSDGIDVRYDEEAFRALSRKMYGTDGLPSKSNFIMRKKDSLKGGPSHLVARHFPADQLGRYFPLEEHDFALLSVGEMLAPVLEKEVRMVYDEDPSFNEHSKAHAVLTGYQNMTNREIEDFQRHLKTLATRSLRSRSFSSSDP